MKKILFTVTFIMMTLFSSLEAVVFNDNNMKEIATTLANNSPQKMNENMILRGVMFAGNRLMIKIYLTKIGQEKYNTKSMSDKESHEEAIRLDTINACTVPTMRTAIDSGYMIQKTYFGVDGTYIYVTKVDKATCIAYENKQGITRTYKCTEAAELNGVTDKMSRISDGKVFDITVAHNSIVLKGSEPIPLLKSGDDVVYYKDAKNKIAFYPHKTRITYYIESTKSTIISQCVKN